MGGRGVHKMKKHDWKCLVRKLMKKQTITNCTVTNVQNEQNGKVHCLFPDSLLSSNKSPFVALGAALELIQWLI